MRFEPKERASAIERGDKRYFTGRPCKHGHVAERTTSSGGCVVCERKKYNLWAEANRDRLKELWNKSYAKNAEKRRLEAAEYRVKNPDKVKEACRKSKAKNRAYHTYLESQRLEKIRQATPPWISKEQKEWIVDIYKCAKDIKECYETPTAVDHIIPIKGKNVCGLNVPWNMRVVTQSYNSQKSNNMEDCPPLYQSQNSIMVHESALPWNLRS